MKLVTQEDRTGCAIAAVAMVGGVTYRAVKSVAADYGIAVTDSGLWSETSYIYILLKHFGVIASKQKSRFLSWDALPPLALLSLKWHKVESRAYWHWVVYWRGPQGPVVFDPNTSLRKNVRRDFGRMQPKWYIVIRSSPGV